MLLKLAAGAALLLATASAASSDTANQDKPASLATSTNGNNAFFAFGPPALTGIAAAALTAPNSTVTGKMMLWGWGNYMCIRWRYDAPKIIALS